MKNNLYDMYMARRYLPLTDDYINSVFEKIIEKDQEVLNYVNNFKIENTENGSLGTYSIEDKEIVIDKERIIHSNPGVAINKSLYALEVIYHELQHAKNLMKIDEGKDDIESTVLKYALKEYAIMNNLDFSRDYELDELGLLRARIKDNYETNPGERIAEIKAWKELVNLLKNQRNTRDLLAVRTMLFYSYIRGYHDNNYYIDAPTLDFLLNTEQFHDLKILKRRLKSKQYNLDTRLLCGLPITYEEYDKKVLQKVKLQKRKH